MELHLSLDDRGDLRGQVYRQIRAAVLEGRLRAGQPVPSTRELAGQLAVSRNTVGFAYDRLVAEGFLTCRVGVGTYVSTEIGADARTPRRCRPPAGSPLRPRPVWDEVTEPPDLSTVEPEFDLRSGIPDARHFPYPTWRALVANQLRPTAVRSGTHIDAAGHPGLRGAIARHVGVSRGVRASADDVFVTNGSQQAVDLVTRVLLEPGDLVAVEDPGYPPPRRAFTAHGMGVTGVPVDAEGLVVDAIPAGTRLVYICPSHQYPLGMSMSRARRMAILDWAERADGVIVEDDYDSEFRFAGRALEPLHTLDRTGRVLYMGSFSKVMLPTLRLGFLIAPAPLHTALRKAKHVTDLHTAVPEQAAMAQFIDEGLLARHIRRMRGTYAERHHRLSAALDQDCGDYLAPIESAVGLHLAAVLRDGVGYDDVSLVDRAAMVGVALQALSAYSVGSARHQGVLLGYGTIPTHRIPEAVRRLRRCLRPRP